MIDINPSFVPRTVKPLPFQVNNVNRPSSVKGKGKAKAEPESGGLLTFFGTSFLSAEDTLMFDRILTAPKTLTRSNSAPTKRTAVPGKGSGKRTLVNIHDEDLAAKRVKIHQASSSTNLSLLTHSRFFPSPSTSKQQVEQAAVDLMPSSRIHLPLSDKENLPDHADNVIVGEDLDEIIDEYPDPVTQEDGYLSPSPSYFRSATPDLSSPVRPNNLARRDHCDEDDFGADIIPSPTAVKTVTRNALHQCLLPKKEKVSILVRETPPPMNGLGSADEMEGPDLRDILGIEALGDIDAIDDDDIITPASSSSTISPKDNGANDEIDIDESAEEHTVTEANARVKRTKIVANGWWNKWALNKDVRTTVRIEVCVTIVIVSDMSNRPQKTAVLRRRETTMTPDGRQAGCRTRLGSAPPKVRFPMSTEVASRAGGTLKAVGGTNIRNSSQFMIGKSSVLGQEERPEGIGSRFGEFRCG
jgi:exonuclease-1